MVFALFAPSLFAATWSTATANTILSKFPDPDAFHWVGETNHFSWQAGYTMFVMEKMWRLTGDITYYNYIKKYVDQQVDNSGNIPDFVPNQLDNFLPGYAILLLYEQTGLQKYKIAAQTIRNAFNTYPRNSDGGFWHSVQWGAHQMWVDGVFMGQMFLARYGKSAGDSAYAFDEVVKQMTLIVNHCQKPNGLLLHAWDETKSASWANRSTGLAPCVWSEGLGWYAVLIADVLDFLPAEHKGRGQILAILQKLCAGLKSCQDPKTGMWSQVVDSVNGSGNWNETSGTGMFLYLIKKSIDKGYIPATDYKAVVEKAYVGIQAKGTLISNDLVDVKDCSSIGVQNNYSAYINCPKEVNPFSGVASFTLGTSCMELQVTAGLTPFPSAASRAGLFSMASASSMPSMLASFPSDRYSLALQSLSGRTIAKYCLTQAAGFTSRSRNLAPGYYYLTVLNGSERLFTTMFVRY